MLKLNGKEFLAIAKAKLSEDRPDVANRHTYPGSALIQSGIKLCPLPEPGVRARFTPSLYPHCPMKQYRIFPVSRICHMNIGRSREGPLRSQRTIGCLWSQRR